jgi:hypothetical protein
MTGGSLLLANDRPQMNDIASSLGRCCTLHDCFTVVEKV